MAKQYRYRVKEISAIPRTGREIDAIKKTSFVGGLGGSSSPGYWKLETTDAEGNPLAEGMEYIHSDYSAHTAGSFRAERDVVAFSDENLDMELPEAYYGAFGTVRIMEGDGLEFYDGEDGKRYLRVDKSFSGEGGFNEETLKAYLTTNKYINEAYLSEHKYLKLTDPLTGYLIADSYTPITPTDTILTALGKLEKNFSSYVDLTTAQTIDGDKFFKKTVKSTGDFVAYADANYDIDLPMASYKVPGVVLIAEGDGLEFYTGTDGNRYLRSLGGGGISFTPGTALELTAANVLNVRLGTTGTTACAGNDARLSNARPNPYALTFTGYSTGTYTGASSLTVAIPNNTSQLTNGAGYITGINKTMILNALSGNKTSSTYLAGDGTFYTISASEITFPSGYVTLTTSQTIAGLKHFTPGFSSGDKSNIWIQVSAGNNICGMNRTEVGNLYLNYTSSLKNVRIDADCNVRATGDIIAFADGNYDVDLPIASQSAYGAVKVDNNTIQINSSGQIYCTLSGGGGGSTTWANITGKPSWIGSSKPTYSWSEISGKPSWIGTYKPSYSWSEITGKPSVLSSISYSVSGSGNVVTNVTASGSTVYVTKGTISGGSGALGTWVYLPSGGSVFTTSGNNIGVKLTGGNGIAGWNNTGGVMGNLYLNYRSGSQYIVIDTVGNGQYTGSWTKVSDMRKKRREKSLCNVLHTLERLDVFYYFLKEDSKRRRQLGMSAQQIMSLYPEVVVEDSDGFLGVDYGNLSVVALQGVKELHRKFLQLENGFKSLTHWKTTKDQQIEFLMKENALLKTRITELERGAA